MEAEPRIGSEIAGYRIERQLGRGGMSVVYLAEQVALKRKVALKLLAPELSGDVQFRERFLRESELAASLDHPNVIPIFDAGEAGGVLFLAMRYVEGSDLAKRLAKDGWLEPAEAVSILERVADALDGAHKRGLVHRDVKPGNVLLSDDGHVYLSDFGLTRRTEETAALTESGQFVGTLDYVSPEQIENKDVSAATDVYALACVLFECLTGEVPFRGDSKMGVMFAHLQSEPPSASERNPELRAGIDGVLARGMAKEPGDRYETCGGLAQEARSALGLSGELAAPAVVQGRRRRMVWLVGAVVVVAAVVAAIVAGIVVTGGGDAAAVGDDWSRVPHNQSAFGGTDRKILALGLASAGEGLVAVGTDGELEGNQSEGAVWLSKDGLNWERVRSGLAGPYSQFLNAVASGPSGLVAVGAVGLGSPLDLDAAVWTSPDGTDWTRVPHDEDVFGGEGESPYGGIPNQFMNDVVSGGPGFVAVGQDDLAEGAAVWTSPDGLQWSRVPADPDIFGPMAEAGLRFDGMHGVAAAADGAPLVAVGADGTPAGQAAAVWVSLDGEAWTRVPHDDAAFGDLTSFVEMWDVVEGGPGFVAVGTDATVSPRSRSSLTTCSSSAPG